MRCLLTNASRNLLAFFVSSGDFSLSRVNGLVQFRLENHLFACRNKLSATCSTSSLHSHCGPKSNSALAANSVKLKLGANSSCFASLAIRRVCYMVSGVERIPSHRCDKSRFLLIKGSSLFIDSLGITSCNSGLELVGHYCRTGMCLVWE
jgi:hypothetical protein